MTTSDLLLVSKYGEFGTFFFPPNKPFVHFLSFALEFFFVTTVRGNSKKKKEKKNTHHHTLQ
jgi:hypothetical protein